MNLRTGSLVDVGLAEVDELRTIGETLFVERKVRHQPVRDVLGPAVASLANTLGGWVLLGVEDDRGAEPGSVVGWEPKGRASAQDYIRDLLQGCVDPVPPFAAKVVELADGQTVGVVRVAESVDVPHVVAPTGSVWTRGQGGKEPVTSHRDLMALAERGRVARTRADERLTGLPHVELAMRRPPDHQPEDVSPDDAQTVIVRVSPIVVPETFADAALAEATATRAAAEALRALRRPEGDPNAYRGPVQPLARGLQTFAARTWRYGTRSIGVDLVLDAGGVAAVRFVWWDEDIGTTGQEVIGYAIRAATAAASLLESCGAVGRCLIRCDYSTSDEPQLSFGHDAGRHRAGTTIMTEDLVLPADDAELERISGRWLRELARQCRVAMWEVPSSQARAHSEAAEITTP